MSPSWPELRPLPYPGSLNAPDSVAKETLRRVRDAIDRTGYVPNLLAGGLASSRSRLIAAVVPTIAAPVFQDTWEALTDTFADCGLPGDVRPDRLRRAPEDALLDPSSPGVRTASC